MEKLPRFQAEAFHRIQTRFGRLSAPVSSVGFRLCFVRGDRQRFLHLARPIASGSLP